MLNALKNKLLSVLTIGGLLITISPAVSITPNNKLTLEANTVADKSSNSVVEINAYKEQPVYSMAIGDDGQVIVTQSRDSVTLQEVGAGSGFFVTSDGYIITNNHVVEDFEATYKVNYKDDQQIPAEVVYRDESKDLAIIKIKGDDYPTIPLGDSSALRIGEKVVAIGNPFGKYINHATQGKVTGLNRTLAVRGENGSVEKLKGIVQTNAKLYPGDSGGPLLNLDGEVVAINTAMSVGRRASSGFSVPVNAAKAVIAKAGILQD